MTPFCYSSTCSACSRQLSQQHSGAAHQHTSMQQRNAHAHAHRTPPHSQFWSLPPNSNQHALTRPPSIHRHRHHHRHTCACQHILPFPPTFRHATRCTGALLHRHDALRLLLVLCRGRRVHGPVWRRQPRYLCQVPGYDHGRGSARASVLPGHCNHHQVWSVEWRCPWHNTLIRKP